MRANIHPSCRIHGTAIIEEDVCIGAGTSVWDNVHIRRNACIGENCIIGGKSYIAYDVKVGSGVKINSFVYICTGITIEDQVMISAGTIFTNDRFPRAFALDGLSVMTSEPTSETLETTVCKGATIGAGCVIGPGIELGPFCMIGMGSVVTRNVRPHALAYGNPARLHGYVCVCGEPFRDMDVGSIAYEREYICAGCGRLWFQNYSGELTSGERVTDALLTPGK